MKPRLVCITLTLAMAAHAATAQSAPKIATQTMPGEVSLSNVKLQCEAASESCCAQWLEEAVSLGKRAAKSDQLSTLPARVYHWRSFEKRSACTIKTELQKRYG
jgi:hypothetical protein